MSTSGAVSSNPVERDKAELEQLLTEFNELTGQGQPPAGDPPADPDPASNSEPTPHNDPEPPAPANDDDTFEQKWKSLQGIVKTKDTQIANLTEQVSQLLAQNQQIMAQMQQQQSAPPAKQQDVNTQDTSSENLVAIAESIGDQFGAELGEVFMKFAAHIKKMEETGQGFNDKLNEVSSTISASKAETRLTELCPTWRAVDKDQGFISYLQSTMAPYSDKPMIEVLNENWNAGRIDTVASIFNEMMKAMCYNFPGGMDECVKFCMTYIANSKNRLQTETMRQAQANAGKQNPMFLMDDVKAADIK